VIDLLSPATLRDPYPTYHQLRETAPVHWDEALGGWIVTRHDDVYAALKDPARFSSDRIEKLVTSRVPPEAREALAPFLRLTSQWMWMIDPPEHTRIRKLMNKGFTPRAVNGLQPLAVEIVDSLLDQVAGRGGMDLIADFAYPLPAIMLADIYGIPRDDAHLLKRWSDQLKVFIGGSPVLSATAAEAFASLGEMMRYFDAAVEDRRKEPRDDLITRLVKAEEDGDFLNQEELCANLVLVLAASYVTTMDMIGNGVLALLLQRDQWDLLLGDRNLLRTGIDELLRFDGPVQATHRLATQDVELRGNQIKQGDLVYLIRGAANRDPHRFPDPDRVDVTRTDTAHVAFGAGVHYCIGAALARIEGEIAFNALLDRYPNLRLDPAAAPAWRADSLQFRGLSTLPVLFG
jgi:hypothetical protein